MDKCLIVGLLAILVILVIGNCGNNNGNTLSTTEGFRSRSLDFRKRSGFRFDNSRFIDQDQSAKLDIIESKIEENKVEMNKLINKKKEMADNLSNLDKGINDLRKERDEFIKAQMAMKRMLFG